MYYVRVNHGRSLLAKAGRQPKVEVGRAVMPGLLFALRAASSVWGRRKVESLSSEEFAHRAAHQVAAGCHEPVVKSNLAVGIYDACRRCR